MTAQIITLNVTKIEARILQHLADAEDFASTAADLGGSSEYDERDAAAYATTEARRHIETAVALSIDNGITDELVLDAIRIADEKVEYHLDAVPAALTAHTQ
jgi:hypothetical protein